MDAGLDAVLGLVVCARLRRKIGIPERSRWRCIQAAFRSRIRTGLKCAASFFLELNTLH